MRSASILIVTSLLEDYVHDVENPDISDYLLILHCLGAGGLTLQEINALAVEEGDDEIAVITQTALTLTKEDLK